MLADPVPDDPALVAPPQKRERNWLGWTLAIGIIVSCFFFIDLDELKAALGRLSAIELTLLVLLSTAERFLRGVNWALLLRMVDVRLPILRVVRFFYQGSFSGVFLPSHVGGDILRAWWVMRESGVRHPVIASLVVERLIGFAAAINWGILGGAFYFAHLHPEALTLWIGLGALGLLLANLLLAFFMSARLHDALLARLGGYATARPMRILHKLYESFARFAHDPRRLLLNAGIAFILQGMQMAMFVGIALSIDVVPAIGLFFAATALHGLILKLPIAPDGWGVGEVAAIAVYGLIGVPAAAAFAVSAIGHFIPMLALTPGLLFLLVGNRSPSAVAIRRG